MPDASEAVRETGSSPATKNLQALYQSLVETLPVHIFCKDMEGRFMFGNDLFCRAMGKTLPDILGKTDADFFPPETAAKHRRDEQEVMSSGKVFESVEQFQTPEGGRRHIHVFKVPLRDHSGGLIGIQGMSWDVTAHERAEAALRESEIRFRSLAEASPAAILIHQGGPFRYVNEVMEQMTGCSRQELLKMNFWEVIHPDHRDHVRERGEARSRGGAPPPQYEFKILTKSGQTRWVELRAKATEFEGQPAVLATLFDVTERKRVEEALQQSEELFSKAFRALSVGVGVVRLSDRQFIEVNEAFLKLFGFRREEVLGHTPVELGLWADSKQREETLTRLMTEGSLKNVEGKARKKSGVLGDMLVSMELVEMGGEKCILALFTDITERKRAEELATQFGTILDNSSNEIYVFEAGSLRFTRVSLGARQNLGYTMEELQALTPLDIKPDFSREQFVAMLDPLRTGNRDRLLLETRHRRKDGTFYAVEVRLQMALSTGAPMFLAIIQDITERKQAEEALRASESRFRLLVQNSPYCIHEIDREGRLISMNPVGLEMMSVRDESAICGKRCLDIVADVDKERISRLLDLALQGQSSEFEFATTNKRHFQSSFVPIRDETGVVQRLMGLTQDITKRKQAEEQLLQQASLLDLAQDAIIIRDMEGLIRFWNKAAENLSGLTAKEAIGRKVTELVYKDPTAFDAIQKQLLEKGEWAGEVNLVVKGGREVILNSRSTLVRDEHGKPKSVLVINTDITDKKKLEAQFLRAQRMEGLGMLASGIAHDLNNILTPILMASPLMRQGKLDEREIQKIMDMIHTNAQRGVDIVKQLLTFGRGSLGERITVQPRHLVKDMVKMSKETFPKNILVNAKIADDLWNVMGDPTQIHQLLLNLCLNARDAMPNGGMLTISAENTVLDDYFVTQNLDAKAGSHVLFTVADNGTGIAPEILHKIFDPFFTTKEVGKGTGLGLSTVLGIVKGHEGFIKVYSEPGRGSTFNVYLPATPAAVAPEAAPAASALPRGQGELILVVDDEKPLLEMTQKVLERQGYQVLTAGDGTEALALFAPLREKIQVVLTDISMPIMDGVALARVLKKMEPGLNVIAASGRGSGGKASDLKALGVETFLTKPYAIDKLVKTLHGLLHEKNLNPADGDVVKS